MAEMKAESRTASSSGDQLSAKYTVTAALRATGAILWQETDRFTRLQLVLSFALLVVGSVLGALLPVAYKLIIDVFSGAAPRARVATPIVLIAAYIVCVYIINISAVVRQFVHAVGMQRLSRRLSNRLFGHLVRLPLGFHLNRKTGAIGETLQQGLGGCQIVLQHAVFTFLPVVVEFSAIVVVLIHFRHSAYLALIGASAIAYGYTFWRAAEQIAEPSREVSDAHVDAHATLTDSLLNYETIKYFSGETAICKRYDRVLTSLEQSWRGLLKLRTRNGLVLETIYAIAVGVSLSYAGYEVLRHTMTVGDFVLINTYVARLYQPLEAIGMAARDISQGLAFLQRMLDIFHEKQEGEKGSSRDVREQVDIGEAPVVASMSAGDALHVRGELTFEHVNFSYKRDREILRNVNLHVPSGKTLAIVGVSGSGKSSIVRLLFRLYEPEQGRILLDGKPILHLPLAQLRQAIAIVPQDTVLFNTSLGENIAFGRPHATQGEIEAAAEIAHLHHFISGLPDGYATEVGERGLKLSGGEKQRVAIARAALKHPRIFVFDEATSSLDSKSEREILRNLLEVSQNCTTVVIAHRLSTIIHADEILVLERGVVVEQGTHTELLEAGGSYSVLWKAQQGNGASGFGKIPSVA